MKLSENSTAVLKGIIKRIQFIQLFILTACLCVSACSHQNTDSIAAPNNPRSRNQITLSQEALKSAKLEILKVENRPDQLKIITTGEIKADDNRVFHINSIVAGRLIKDNVGLGKIIKRGDVLAVVQNLEVARTYSDYIHQAHQNNVDLAQVQARLDLAKKTAQRLAHLNQEGIVAEKDLLTAENQQRILEIDQKGLREHQLHIKAEAKTLLAAYGISLEEEEKKGIDNINSGSPIIAPKSGVVIKKNITVGDVVSPTDVLYVVADLSQIWLDIAVYDKDLETVKERQEVIFHSDSLPKKTFSGSIGYIQPLVGDTSKIFLARAVLPNPAFILKPGMFGQVEINSKNDRSYPYLPDRALQKYGNDNFVFVEQPKNTFEKRIIKLGNRSNDGYLITDGITAGESIVGDGSFKLKSELLKSEIGN
jgi:cobalt-zinc-cadmium efflux system membrane fusion protein